jgi:hypothetical protein
MCFVWIWEQTAIISLYSFNWLVFITVEGCLLRGSNWIFNSDSYIFVLKWLTQYQCLNTRTTSPTPDTRLARWCQTSRDLEVYILSPVRQFHCLRYCVKRRTASTRNYVHTFTYDTGFSTNSAVRQNGHVHFFICTIFNVWEVSSIFRQFRNVYISLIN